MHYAPVTVFSAIASVVAQQGIGVLLSYSKFIGEFYLGLLVPRVVKALIPSCYSSLNDCVVMKKCADWFCLWGTHLDIHMPIMDGLSATRLIRNELKLDKLPIIALTDGIFSDEQQSAMDAGINSFLSKLMNVDKLEKMLRYHYEPSRF